MFDISHGEISSINLSPRERRTHLHSILLPSTRFITKIAVRCGFVLFVDVAKKSILRGKRFVIVRRRMIRGPGSFHSPDTEGVTQRAIARTVPIEDQLSVLIFAA